MDNQGVTKDIKTGAVGLTTILGSVLTVVLLLLYFVYVQSGALDPLFQSIRGFGLWGVLISILLLAILCVLPVPSEFLIVLNMEVYGAVWGIFYSWLGGIFGAVAALYLTRWVARPTIERITGRYLKQVDSWIQEQGSMGLLAVRFIPLVPYHLVNYVAGVLRVRLWPYVWTTAIGILPFDIAMAGMFAGVRHGTLVWGISGGVILLMLILLGVLYRKYRKDRLG